MEVLKVLLSEEMDAVKFILAREDIKKNKSHNKV